jgi:hypothetical protein
MSGFPEFIALLNLALRSERVIKVTDLHAGVVASAIASVEEQVQTFAAAIALITRPAAAAFNDTCCRS